MARERGPRLPGDSSGPKSEPKDPLTANFNLAREHLAETFTAEEATFLEEQARKIHSDFLPWLLARKRLTDAAPGLSAALGECWRLLHSLGGSKDGWPDNLKAQLPAFTRQVRHYAMYFQKVCGWAAKEDDPKQWAILTRPAERAFAKALLGAAKKTRKLKLSHRDVAALAVLAGLEAPEPDSRLAAARLDRWRKEIALQQSRPAEE